MARRESGETGLSLVLTGLSPVATGLRPVGARLGACGTAPPAAARRPGRPGGAAIARPSPPCSGLGRVSCRKDSKIFISIRENPRTVFAFFSFRFPWPGSPIYNRCVFRPRSAGVFPRQRTAFPPCRPRRGPSGRRTETARRGRKTGAELEKHSKKCAEYLAVPFFFLRSPRRYVPAALPLVAAQCRTAPRPGRSRPRTLAPGALSRKVPSKNRRL